MFLVFSVTKNVKMDHFRVCQLCRNCKKTSKVFKVKLSYYDANGKININPIQSIREFAFQCELCSAVSVVDFDQVCNPATVLELRRVEKERKEKIEQVIQDLISLINDC